MTGVFFMPSTVHSEVPTGVLFNVEEEHGTQLPEPYLKVSAPLSGQVDKLMNTILDLINVTNNHI
jgi:hypothetical protein